MGGFKVIDHMVFDALTDAYSGVHMGITAENVAIEWNVSREDMDALAIQSQKRAEEAIKEGKFREEIVPIAMPWKVCRRISLLENQPPLAMQKPRSVARKKTD